MASIVTAPLAFDLVSVVMGGSISLAKQTLNIGPNTAQAGRGAEPPVPPTPVSPKPPVPQKPHVPPWPVVPPLAQFPAPDWAPHSPGKPPAEPLLPAVPGSLEVFRLPEHPTSNATAGSDHRSAARKPRSKCRTGRVPEAATAVFVRM